MTRSVPAVGERPPPARITDWIDPVFSPDIAELRSSLEPMAQELELTPDAVVGEARAGTGLDDLGTDGAWGDDATFSQVAPGLLTDGEGRPEGMGKYIDLVLGAGAGFGEAGVLVHPEAQGQHGSLKVAIERTDAAGRVAR